MDGYEDEDGGHSPYKIIVGILTALLTVIIVMLMLPIIVSLAGGTNVTVMLHQLGQEGYVCVAQGANLEWPTGRGATITVAANDSSTLDKVQADYVCDGSDDEDTINPALVVAAGGKCLLYEGNYTTTSSIVVPGSTTLEGVGVLAAKITRSATADGITIVNAGSTAGGTTGCVVRNIWIDGNDGVASGTSTPGIIFRNMSHGLIENCWVQNTQGGAHPSGPDDRFYRGVGVGVDACSDVIIRGNYATDNSHAGITARNSCTAILIDSNISEYNGHEGIVVGNKTFGASSTSREACSDIIITNNTTRWNSQAGSSWGIYIEDQANAGTRNKHQRITIENNLVENEWAGIGIVAQTGVNTFIGNHKILGNTITNVGTWQAINIDWVGGNLVAENVITNVNSNGILIQDSGTNTVVNNTLAFCGLNAASYGIYIHDSPNCLIDGNRLSDMAGASVLQLDDSDRTAVINNYFIRNSSGAQVIYYNSSADCSLTDNYFTYSLIDEILIDDSPDCNISRNDINQVDNNNPAITIKGTSARAKVVANAIYNVDNYGGECLYLDENADDCLVASNHITNISTAGLNSKGIGIDTDGNEITGNYIINTGFAGNDGFFAGIALLANSSFNRVNGNYVAEASRSDLDIRDQGTNNIITNNYRERAQIATHADTLVAHPSLLPGSPMAGMLWYNPATPMMACYDGAAWNNLW